VCAGGFCKAAVANGTEKLENVTHAVDTPVSSPPPATHSHLRVVQSKCRGLHARGQQLRLTTNRPIPGT